MILTSFKYLPAGLSKYVLQSFTDKSPPFHPKIEDVVKSGIPVDIEKTTGHQLVRGRGGKLAVMYVCMYIFIKLHITTQSGPVILVILCHSH